MSRVRKFEDWEPHEQEMQGDEFDEEEYEDDLEDEDEYEGEEEFDEEFFEEVTDDAGGDLWILCKGTLSKRMRQCDTNKGLEYDWMSSSSDYGRLDSPTNVDVKPQDADYFSFSQLGDDLETMIMARVPILEFRKLCLLNKRYLELTKNGDLLKVRRNNGVKEACVFMLASGEENWWAFDEQFISYKALPSLPCDDAFKFGDKETLCVGTQLLVCGYAYDIDGPMIWTYDLIMNRWSQGPSMFEPRCLFASASYSDFAYVAGGIGSENNAVLNSAEKYNPRTRSWDPILNMTERRKMCSGVYMDNKFYVIGGQGENGDVLTCAEVFHEERNMWVKIPGMLHGLTLGTTLGTTQSPPLLAVVNNELYLLEASSNCLMVYLKDRNCWKDLGLVPVRADINSGWGVAFKSLGDKLLVIGSSTFSVSGRGMTVYTCIPNPNAERLSWNLLAGGVGNSRSHFIMNCTVMVA